MDEQNVVYTYNGILFSLKTEGNSEPCYNMDETWRRYAERNKPGTKEQILYDPTFMKYPVKFLEAESRTEITRGGEGEGLGSYCLMGTEF